MCFCIVAQTFCLPRWHSCRRPGSFQSRDCYGAGALFQSRDREGAEACSGADGHVCAGPPGPALDRGRKRAVALFQSRDHREQLRVVGQAATPAPDRRVRLRRDSRAQALRVSTLPGNGPSAANF